MVALTSEFWVWWFMFWKFIHSWASLFLRHRAIQTLSSYRNFDKLCLTELVHFIWVITFLGVGLFIAFSYYPFHDMGSIVMSSLSFLIIIICFAFLFYLDRLASFIDLLKEIALIVLIFSIDSLFSIELIFDLFFLLLSMDLICTPFF